MNEDEEEMCLRAGVLKQPADQGSGRKVKTPEPALYRQPNGIQSSNQPGRATPYLGILGRTAIAIRPKACFPESYRGPAVFRCLSKTVSINLQV